MSYGLFEELSLFDEGKRTSKRQAVAVAQKRVSDFLGNFIRVATTGIDRTYRIALVRDELHRIIADVADEYDADAEKLEAAIMESLGDGVTDLDGELANAPSAVGGKSLATTKRTAEYTVEQLEDGSGKFKIVGPTGGSEGVEDSRQDAQAIADEKNKTSARVADADRDGGGAVKSEDLPTANDAGDLGDPSPKTDHTTWKPNALNDSGNVKPIDTEQDGSPVPSATQDVTDTPEWKNQGSEGDNFLDQTDSVTEQQDLPSADESGQSTNRNIEQPHTDTFNNDGQADPVTSRTALSPVHDPEAAQNQQDKYDFKDDQRLRGEQGMNPTYEVAPATEEHCDALGNCGADYLRAGKPLYTVLKNGQPHTMFDETGQHLDKGLNPVTEGPAAELAAPYQASVDPDKNPIREILESEMPTDHQVQAAITEFENVQS